MQVHEAKRSPYYHVTDGNDIICADCLADCCTDGCTDGTIGAPTDAPTSLPTSPTFAPATAAPTTQPTAQPTAATRAPVTAAPVVPVTAAPVAPLTTRAPTLASLYTEVLPRGCCRDVNNGNGVFGPAFTVASQQACETSCSNSNVCVGYEYLAL